MGPWLFSTLLLAASTAPLELTFDPQPGKFFTATLAGFPSGADGGEFRGSVALNGSSAEMPLVGRVERVGGRLRLSATLRYADVPSDWVSRFRADGFDCRVWGEVAGSAPVSWFGTLRWDEVAVAPGACTLSAFVKLDSLELTALSAGRSEGRAVVTIANPFSFPVTMESSSYEVVLAGEKVGRGTARGRVLPGRRKSRLELPFTVEHLRFLAAAGPAWAAGGELDVELHAWLKLRLSSVDLSVPFNAKRRMGTDGARSGPEALPEGATSLSPRR